MNSQKLVQNIDEFIKRFEEVKKEEKLDLSADQDLSIAIMNLVSIEEHFFFTGAKTQKTKYYDLIRDIREMRKELLKKLVKDYEGEVWCISKHLLAASYRLMEVGTKYLGENKKETAYDFFKKAYDLYSLFWGINLRVIDIGEVKKISEEALNKGDTEGTLKNLDNNKNSGLFDKLGKLVKKVIDCCIE